jgi:hypothetical protein
MTDRHGRGAEHSAAQAPETIKGPTCYGCKHLGYNAPQIQTHAPLPAQFGCAKYGWVQNATETPRPVTDSCKEL